MSFYEFTTKIARVRIGDDVWESGDGVLTPDIIVNLSENKSASTGSFTLYDPGLKISAKYRELSIKSGGIVVNQNLLDGRIGDDPKPDYVPNTSINNFESSAPVDGQKLSWRDNEIILTREALKVGWNKNQIIFLLATALHEAGDPATKYPVGDPGFLAEKGSDSYFARYANVKGIGNNGRKDWAVRYKGRGYIQITGRGVYQTTGKAIGIDLVNSPEFMQKPDVAAKTAVYLLSTRPPTGYKNIKQFGLLTDKPDFYNARRMVNGIKSAQMKQYMAGVRIYQNGGGFEKIRGQQLSNVDDLIKAASGGSSGGGGGVKTVAQTIKKSVSKVKVGNWPYPKQKATRDIIITPGHKLDITSGTSGTSSRSVYYKGETRTTESVAAEIAAEVFIAEFSNAGFNVLSAPAVGSARGNSARIRYQSLVRNLETNTNSYALELHFDIPNGGKPGVIAGGRYDASGKHLNEMDVALAKEFGYFSYYWGVAGKDVRKGGSRLGAIAKGITILELDRLNSTLTNATINGVNSGNLSQLRSLLKPYALRAVKALSSVVPEIENTSNTGLNQLKKTMEKTKNYEDAKKIAAALDPNENTKKGTELIIEMMVGTNAFTELIAFHFIHTETNSSKEYGAEKTTFTGKSVRWKLTRIPQTQTFQNITLRNFAQRVAKEFNLKLVMEGQGLTYHYLPQDGETAYQVLEREARRIGFKITDSPRSNELIIKPYARPNFTGFVVDDELLISCKFSDKATASPRYIPGVLESQTEENGASNKFSINRQTGVVNQSKPDSKTGAMKSGVTGKSAPPAGGIVKPNNTTPTVGGITLNQLGKLREETKEIEEKKSKIVEPEQLTTKKFTRKDGVTVEVETKTQTTKEYLKITKVEIVTTTINNADGSKEKTIKKTTYTYLDTGTITEIEETDKNSAIFSEKIESPKINKEVFSTRNIPTSVTIGTVSAIGDIDEATGMPKVKPGTIQLIDGFAEQQTLLSENSRIKGYEGSLILRTVKDVLELVPGQIISLSPRIFNKEFATELRIEDINHNFKDGKTNIRFYIPLRNEPETPSKVENTGVTDLLGKSLSDNIAPSKSPSASNTSLIMPTTGVVTSGIGMRTLRGRTRMHKGLDIANKSGTPIVAPGNASVIYAKFIRGYGNQVAISLKVPSTGETVFMTFSHGQKGGFRVKSGQQVKQGQVLMLMGSTGFSTGPHLHWETYRGGLNKTLIKPSEIGYKIQKPRSAPYGR